MDHIRTLAEPHMARAEIGQESNLAGLESEARTGEGVFLERSQDAIIRGELLAQALLHAIAPVDLGRVQGR
jgi:hypothetical protein